MSDQLTPPTGETVENRFAEKQMSAPCSEQVTPAFSQHSPGLQKEEEAMTDESIEVAAADTYGDVRSFFDQYGAIVAIDDCGTDVLGDTDQQMNRATVTRQLDRFKIIQRKYFEQLERKFGDCPLTRLLLSTCDTKNNNGGQKNPMGELFQEELEDALSEIFQGKDIDHTTDLLITCLAALRVTIIVYEMFILAADGEVSEQEFLDFHNKQFENCLMTMEKVLILMSVNWAEIKGDIDGSAVHEFLKKSFETHREYVVVYLAFLNTIKSFSLVLGALKNLRKPTSEAEVEAKKKRWQAGPVAEEELKDDIKHICEHFHFIFGTVVRHLLAQQGNDYQDLLAGIREMLNSEPFIIDLEFFQKCVESDAAVAWEEGKNGAKRVSAFWSRHLCTKSRELAAEGYNPSVIFIALNRMLVGQKEWFENIVNTQTGAQ